MLSGSPLLLLIVGFVIFFILLYWERGYWAWVFAAVCFIASRAMAGISMPGLFWTIVVILGVLALIFGIPTLRRMLISRNLVNVIKHVLPKMGDTERVALEAGTVWWEKDLFSGRPDWEKFLAFKPMPLTDAEQAFVDGPTEELCRMVDDYQIYQDRGLDRFDNRRPYGKALRSVHRQRLAPHPLTASV